MIALPKRYIKLQMKKGTTGDYTTSATFLSDIILNPQNPQLPGDELICFNSKLMHMEDFLDIGRKKDTNINFRLEFNSILRAREKEAKTPQMAQLSNLEDSSKFPEKANCTLQLGDSLKIEYFAAIDEDRSVLLSGYDTWSEDFVLTSKTSSFLSQFLKEDTKKFSFGLNSQEQLFFEYKPFNRISDKHPFGILHLKFHGGHQSPNKTAVE